MITFGVRDIRGVKRSALWVSVSRPGVDPCCPGYAIGGRHYFNVSEMILHYCTDCVIQGLLAAVQSLLPLQEEGVEEATLREPPTRAEQVRAQRIEEYSYKTMTYWTSRP